jgi:hypothetical protein
MEVLACIREFNLVANLLLICLVLCLFLKFIVVLTNSTEFMEFHDNGNCSNKCVESFHDLYIGITRYSILSYTCNRCNFFMESIRCICNQSYWRMQ